MTKYILVGGYVHKASDGGKAFCEELVKGIDKKPVKILDCLFARDKEDWDERFMNDKKFFNQNTEYVELELADPLRFREQIANSDIVFFQGGVPRKLISILETAGDWLKELENKILIGTSGGADAICKYYGVGKTGNIGEGLGLLPIKYIPHWESKYAEGIDINWGELLEKLKSYKEDLPVFTLREGEFKVFNT